VLYLLAGQLNVCRANGDDRILLRDLERCNSDAVKVSQCFIEHSSRFDVYSFYCSNYPRSVVTCCAFDSNNQKFHVDAISLLY